MEANTGIVKKTPGDIERERIAIELHLTSPGAEWKFSQNYTTGERNDITTDLEKQKQAGQIEDWRAGQQAFEDNGRPIHSSQGLAAYIRPKAQVK